MRGTAITMFKVDNLNDLTLQSESSDLVANDFTINTYSSDVLGKQYDNTVGKVLPFSAGVTGPRNLRGRVSAYAPSLGGKNKK